MLNNDRIKSGIIGAAVGDALGMPYETAKRGSFDIYKDTESGKTMRGYSQGMPAYWYTNNMPPGVWTDDTAMTLAELESMVRLGRIDLDDIMNNFRLWHYEGKFSATGVAIGQGRQTVNALERYCGGIPAVVCGGADERDNGNGSLMRMLPFVFCEKLMKSSGVTIAELSSLTHAHPISVKACEIYIAFVQELNRTHDKSKAALTLLEHSAPYHRLSNIQGLPEQEIQSSGYVVHTLEAVMWCFLATDSYTDCVLKAVSLGGDTDTIAAIAGGIAGMYYGVDSIPEAWLASLCRRDLINKITDSFIEII